MAEIADFYQWKWVRGQDLTVKMDFGAIAPSDTFVPVGLSSNLMENAPTGGAVWGVVKNQCAASAKATDDNAPPVVIVSEDIFECRCTGDLSLGEQVQVLDDNAVTTYVSSNLACGVVVDYDPAASVAYNATDKGYSTCHIKAIFESNLGTGYLNEA